LNLHHHERYIVALRFAMGKVGNFGKDALNDFIWSQAAAGPQQAPECF
jgi:hypothetical protein